MKSSPMTIGQVADHFGLPAHVLRHWESVGLLSPARVEAGRRRYTRDDLFQVASIMIMKQAGLPLSDIRDFLASSHTPARKDMLRRNYRALQVRMATLRSALDLLEAGLNCPHEDIATCPNARAHLAKLVDVQGSV
ncbi:DNA-binding transcriptional MerR regulator [Pseudonocardia kunmingensis]|uniref:DNA-binding transcriptional MerR regulator n=2 Tax=Pseudonocardia kunmingensis TaxID=630975 RepID=A0A543DKJ1_9PSEU|nr:DNA-binding transcriptional MerR regulator [Pseudonocardia kunmingensis]